MDTYSRSLTVKCVSGLSNRLRVLLSGKALAEASGREFAMRWEPTPACGCLYSDLFQNDWNVSAGVRYDDVRAINWQVPQPGGFPNLLALTDSALYVEYFAWLTQPARYPEHSPLQSRCEQLINELELIPALARQVREVRETSFRPVMIGAHIRRGDYLVGHPYALQNGIAFMEQIDRWLDEENQAGILLCTDDGASEPYHGRSFPYENTVTKFVRRYGDRVVTTRPASLDRRTPAAIQGALVDLWLLRATDYFAGTAGSSFSELATFGRSIPNVRITYKSRGYHYLVVWLKRLGIHSRLVRLIVDEYGNQRPGAAGAVRRIFHWLMRLKLP